MSQNAGGGEGGGLRCGVSGNEYSYAHHVTWSPNILWRSNFIFNLWADLKVRAREVRLDGREDGRRGAAHHGVPNVPFDALADAPEQRGEKVT